ncbi:hypothetical protein BC826DRAFT_973393 [Russula brevipes]|nr:hypothetical protein BC826DRAFT_973393 [Russula brevipes]
MYPTECFCGEIVHCVLEALQMPLGVSVGVGTLSLGVGVGRVSASEAEDSENSAGVRWGVGLNAARRRQGVEEVRCPTQRLLGHMGGGIVGAWARPQGCLGRSPWYRDDAMEREGHKGRPSTIELNVGDSETHLKPSNAIDGHTGTVLDGCCGRAKLKRHGYSTRTTDLSGPTYKNKHELYLCGVRSAPKSMP